VLVADAARLQTVFVEQGTQRLATTAGLLAPLRWAGAMGPLTLVAGPQIEALVRPVVVDVAGGEVFRLPSLLASISIDGASE
jgi:hypothetical protein